ncbi:unnamed protein product [Lymnaea stagnalis]|uniref:TIR domain-containing protein n=1 Tax=Lymnaea stagnalis TaxID=6523 RepID=A0AAV2I784_LYMST
MFSYVPNLRQLFIAYNTVSTRRYQAEEYEPCYTNVTDIFDSLPHLENLSIDSLPEMYLGLEFSKFRTLKSLVLYCVDVDRARNDCFIGLSNSTVKHLMLDTFSEVFEPFLPKGAFRHVIQLESLYINFFEIGNHRLMKALKPFNNGSLTSLILNNIALSRYRESPTVTFEDGLLRRNVTKHIANTCLSTLVLANNKLFAIEPGALTGPTWLRCLKRVDLSGNYMAISGWRIVIFELHNFQILEDVTLTSPPATYQDVHTTFVGGVYGVQTLSHYLSNILTNILTNMAASTNFEAEVIFSLVKPSEHYSTSHNMVGSNFSMSATDLSQARKTDRKVSAIVRGLWIRVPKSVKYLRFAYMTLRSYLTFNSDVRFVDAENLKEIYAIGIPQFLYSAGRIRGLENLRVVDVSGSMLSVREYFYDDFPSLEFVVLSHIYPVNYFEAVVSLKRLLQNLTRLTYLDISDNGLNALPPGTFSASLKLEILILAKNRFSSIPFDLAAIPRLKYLDMSENAILFLEEYEMAAIDERVRELSTFTLKLQGNGIFCMCSSIKFVVWLQLTLAKLENAGNYSCASQDDKMTSTDRFSDMKGLWRQCVGSLSLMVTLTLACLMALAFLLVYLMGRFKTCIRAYILRLVAPQFRSMTSDDYKTNVFIGYADDDYKFAINVLLRFLEDDLGVSTFLHHRDLGPGYTDQLFYEAIQNSWRVLLVITTTFLQRYPMADIVMKYASGSLTPVNQGRVFVLVEGSQVHNIPSYLHDVLDDTRIITVHDLDQSLTYEQKQSIIQCLKPSI